MSLIGKRPITVPNGVEITLTGNNIKVKGSKGELEYTFLPLVEVFHEDNQIISSSCNYKRL